MLYVLWAGFLTLVRPSDNTDTTIRGALVSGTLRVPPARKRHTACAEYVGTCDGRRGETRCVDEALSRPGNRRLVGAVLWLQLSWGKQRRRDHDHPQRRLRHDGEYRSGLGRAVPSGASQRERSSARGRIGSWHRQLDRRQLRHGQRQPRDGGKGKTTGRGQAGGQTRTIRGRLRCPGHLRSQAEPAGFDFSRRTGRHLRRRVGASHHAMVGIGRAPGRLGRRRGDRASAGKTAPAPMPIFARPCWGPPRT